MINAERIDGDQTLDTCWPKSLTGRWTCRSGPSTRARSPSPATPEVAEAGGHPDWGVPQLVHCILTLLGRRSALQHRITKKTPCRDRG